MAANVVSEAITRPEALSLTCVGPPTATEQPETMMPRVVAGSPAAQAREPRVLFGQH